jgi:uncharacterized membrane protein YkvA (DUF1232 family)
MTVATARRVTAARALWAVLRGAQHPGSLRAFPRLVRATLAGTYPGMSRSRLLLMLAGVAYILSPVDLMPELLLTVFGLGDDALVAAWLAGTALAESQSYLQWERTRARVIPGEVTNPR